MRTTSGLLLCLLLAGATAACGSSKKATTTAAAIQRLPQSTTADEWASRIAQSFLLPLNKDLNVLNALNVPDVRIYIASANPQTIRILNRRMNHLQECDKALIAIGPPPASAPRQRPVANGLNTACVHYQRVAASILKAVPFLSSGRADVIARGRKLMQDSKEDSRLAAVALGKAICIAQRQPAFRRAGLRPSTC
jgi:hypothetical protein